MMKRLNKLLAILLAVTMMMSLAVVVQAYTITINQTEEGTSYSAYKIFDAVYDTSVEGYTYTIASDSAFLSLFQSGGAYADYFDLYEVTGEDYYIVVAKDTFTTTVAEDLAAYLKANIGSTITVSPVATTTATGTTATLDVIDAGYYFVDTSLGALAFLNTAGGAEPFTINEKNDIPSVTKEVSDTQDGTYGETNNAQVGDTVYFKTTVSNINKATDVVLHDSMDAGLTYTGKVSVYFYEYSGATGVQLVDSDTAVTNYYYEIDTTGVYFKVDIESTDFTDDGTYWILSNGSYVQQNSGSTFYADETYFILGTFDMSFTLDDLTVTDNSYIEVIYSATVNENAVIYDSTQDVDSNDNNANLSYGDSSYSVTRTTQTYVYEINVYKYTGTLSSVDETAIEDVGFVLYYYTDNDPSGGELRYVVASNNSGVYTVGNSGTYYTTSLFDATTFYTDSNGAISIEGLDSDITYYLSETVTPTGYNPLTGDITVNITSATAGSNQGTVSYTYDGTTTSNASKISVQNNKGTVLVSTGGIGTTIFYVVGGILVVGAVVLLITKKRLGNKED